MIPAPAANEEGLSRRGENCRNSPLRDVTNTLQIFYAIFYLFVILPFFIFLKFLKIFLKVGNIYAFGKKNKKKTPLDKINKNKHRIS